MRSPNTPWCLLLLLGLVVTGPATTLADPRTAERQTENVLLVTLDGLRWQEFFGGCDESLLSKEAGGVRDVAALRRRFFRNTAEERRETLLPFLWKTVAAQGQIFGDATVGSSVRVTNGLFFSYPGYSEILCGFADPRIDSNDKKNNPNVTVLEWLNQKPRFNGQVAAWTSWDVFPWIINAERSGIPVDSGWNPVSPQVPDSRRALLQTLADETPHLWDNVRYDAFTIQAVFDFLEQRQPRVLFVSLGETDDFAHEGRYDLYLDAARRNDRMIERLWTQLQSLPQYAGKTSLIITTDHGRGDDRVSWKNHGKDLTQARFIWTAVMGPDTPSLGTREKLEVTQSQIAATVAQLLGEDYQAAVPQAGTPLPGILRVPQASQQPADR
ncbi:MAG: alkaline phosphatase family protein [Planctomycetaceae bacterium]|jgi:hypothetical protein